MTVPNPPAGVKPGLTCECCGYTGQHGEVTLQVEDPEYGSTLVCCVDSLACTGRLFAQLEQDRAALDAAWGAAEIPDDDLPF